MKIAWFTPFATGSAIGRVGQGVAAELAKRCEVDLCHFDSGATLATDVPVRTFRSAADVTPAAIARYDLLVYNLGNYLPYHHEIFLLSRRQPGLVILHDFVMHHFFASYYLEQQKDPTGYTLLMSRLYGEAGNRIARRTLAGEMRGVWESDDVTKFPLFEETLRGAHGVVTHSEFFRKEVEAVFTGPVRKIPLAYQCDTVSPVPTRSELEIDEDRLLIVTVGHVNPNKTIEAVIEALDELGSLSEKVVYAVLGSCSAEYQRTLKALVAAKKLQNSVRFLGAVSHEVLRGYLKYADFCLNLRYPAIEGASASAIEEMLFDKPVIVNRLGFFAELPDDCVIKVDPARRSELTAGIRKLISDQPFRQRLGDLAGKFARAEFRSDRYAADIIAMADEITAARPLLQLSDKVAAILGEIGIYRDSLVVETVGDRMENLFMRHRPTR